MSFLDNLENNLKALESLEQGGIEDQRGRDAAKSRARAAAPWAEKLKRDPWTQALMQLSTKAGFQRRIKVNLIWIDTTLRLEALGHRLEFRPQPDGIRAVFLQGQQEVNVQMVDLAVKPDQLIAEWMTTLEAQKKMNGEAAKKALADQLAMDAAEEAGGQR
jgi:hypothetical protein